MTHEWDAPAYDDLPLPHVAWGQRVLDRMQLRGEERVLDAGCGTGRDLAALLERWPAVRAIGVDASEGMLDVARERLAQYGDRVQLVHANLGSPLPLEEPVDAVMSVAAFHWVSDHDALFRHLAAVMRPGARLTTDCGGAGNIDNVEAGLMAAQGRRFDAKHFADAETTARRLEAAGFDVARVALRPDPLVIDDPGVRSAYLRIIALSAEVANVPTSERGAFADAVRDAMPSPVIDYVRLEIDAIRR